VGGVNRPRRYLWSTTSRIGFLTVSPTRILRRQKLRSDASDKSRFSVISPSKSPQFLRFRPLETDFCRKRHSYQESCEDKRFLMRASCLATRLCYSESGGKWTRRRNRVAARWGAFYVRVSLDRHLRGEPGGNVATRCGCKSRWKPVCNLTGDGRGVGSTRRKYRTGPCPNSPSQRNTEQCAWPHRRFSLMYKTLRADM